MSLRCDAEEDEAPPVNKAAAECDETRILCVGLSAVGKKRTALWARAGAWSTRLTPMRPAGAKADTDATNEMARAVARIAIRFPLCVLSQRLRCPK
jgi:hypothetical protein